VSSAASEPAIPTTIIEPTRGWGALHLVDVWEYRELLYFLVWRDVKVRYKQTALGAAWAILQPLFTMVVFTIFFGKLAGISSQGVPYPVFSYAALLPWSFFAQGVTRSGNSLVGSAHLITRVYFPRLVVPIAAVLAGLVDFALASLVFAGMMIAYHVALTPAMLLLPLFLLLALATALGVGLWLSALTVAYRDFGHITAFLVQLWLFVTPVIYPTRSVTDTLVRVGLPAWLYGLNPMTGVVEGFRWALLGIGDRPGPIVVASTAFALSLLVSGAFYFRRVERTFADVV
jgi:homopolymeric O-antigen transport system permease protein